MGLTDECMGERMHPCICVMVRNLDQILLVFMVRRIDTCLG